MSKNTKRGIYKGVSTAWYPGDWLADSAILSVDIAIEGAWCRALNIMLRDKVSSITLPMEGWARVWRCGVTRCSTIVTQLEASKVCRVYAGSNGNVTLVCRRLERAEKARIDGAKRIADYRAKRARNGTVTKIRGLPSLSSSLSSSVPVDVDMGDVNPPSPLRKGELATAAELTSLKSLVKQFNLKAEWTGKDLVVYEHFRKALTYYSDTAISEAIDESAVPGMTPWALMKTLQEKKEQRRTRGPVYE